MRPLPSSSESDRLLRYQARRSILLATTLILLIGCSSEPALRSDLNQIPEPSPRLEQSLPLTSDWAVAMAGKTLGMEWVLESRQGATDREVCARVRFEPPPADLVTSENCGTVGFDLDFLSIIAKSVAVGQHFGIVLGISDPSITEVRLAFPDSAVVRVPVERQAFVGIVEDPFAVVSASAYRRDVRLATYL